MIIELLLASLLSYASPVLDDPPPETTVADAPAPRRPSMAPT